MSPESTTGGASRVWDAAELARITGGDLTAVSGETKVSGIATDSRDIRPGCGFLAIAGDTHDGHDFASASIAAGASLAIVHRPLDGLPCLVVGNTLDAYAAIAAEHLRRLRQAVGVRVVGITGSSGKTSTKDLLAHVLGASMEVIAPFGSFNNDIGLPATVLRADESTDVLVLEMGMRGLGHIERLCRVAPPDISVVLNVGTAHIGEVGSVEAIAQAKSEIVANSQPAGVAVLNADDCRVRDMSAIARRDVVLFGTAPDAWVRATDVSIDEFACASFHLHIGDAPPAPVRLRAVGAHQVSNALAAAAVAMQAGLNLGDIARALSAAVIDSGWRMEVVRTAAGVTVVNDAYNANPQSMAAALQALRAMGDPGSTRIAVLGDMRELGESAQAEHRALGGRAAAEGVSRLIAVGEHADDMVDGFTAAGGASAAACSDWSEAAALASQASQAGGIVLVKASRALGLERVAEQLIDAFGRVGA